MPPFCFPPLVRHLRRVLPRFHQRPANRFRCQAHVLPAGQVLGGRSSRNVLLRNRGTLPIAALRACEDRVSQNGSAGRQIAHAKSESGSGRTDGWPSCRLPRRHLSGPCHRRRRGGPGPALECGINHPCPTHFPLLPRLGPATRIFFRRPPQPGITTPVSASFGDTFCNSERASSDTYSRTQSVTSPVSINVFRLLTYCAGQRQAVSFCYESN